MKRHTCIICKRYRYEKKLEQVLPLSWACDNGSCNKHPDIAKLQIVFMLLDNTNLEILSNRHITRNILHYYKGKQNVK